MGLARDGSRVVFEDVYHGLGRRFFDEAAWEKHDIGYAEARYSRVYCDLRFLQAMIRAASRQETSMRTLTCCVLAWFLWFCVRAFGWASYGRKG